MNRLIALGVTLLAGVAIGATAIGGLHAQSKPGAYAVVDITEITDPETYKTLIPLAGPAMAGTSGQYIVRTDKITAVDGTPPKRFVIIAFDSMEKAKAWSASAAQKEVDAIRQKASKSREFFVEAFAN